MNYKGRFTIAKKPKASIILKIAFGFKCIDWLDWKHNGATKSFFFTFDKTFNLVIRSVPIIEFVCHKSTSM